MPSHARSHPISAAQAIIKRRDKPFRPPKGPRKRASNIPENNTAPAGYIYLPIGTPELAERCKKLSKERGVRMYIVNASRVQEANRISSHVHRSGYHFAAEIAEEACEQLRYMPQDGNFVKVEDLEKELRNSGIAKTLAKYNVPADVLISKQNHEELEKVRVAIRELFPKIPDKDLEEVIKHAWAEGTDRIGNQKHYSLARRVQLAVIATIRHNYTDYDRLLKAFDWHTAREECEPHCLEKLIQWRGEDQAAQDDEHLVEMVRDAIVMDNGPQAEHTDASDNSDTDVQLISHEVGDDSDVAPESAGDTNQRRRHGHDWSSRRDDPQATARARELLQAAFQRRMTTPAVVTPVFVPPNRRGELAEEIEVNGQRFRRMTEPPPQTQASQQWAQRNPTPYDTDQTVVQSIEQPPVGDRRPPPHTPHGAPYTTVSHTSPSRGEEDHANKRRRVATGSLHQHALHNQHNLVANGTQTPMYPGPIFGQQSFGPGLQMPPPNSTTRQMTQSIHTPPSAPYDPEHPLLDAGDYRRHSATPKAPHSPMKTSHGFDFANPGYALPPGTPVHGAPAPVQQVQVVYRNPDGSYSMPARPDVRRSQAPPSMPIDGAVAPTQFWSQPPPSLHPDSSRPRY